MTTPTFIRFGEDGDMIFNTAEILSLQHEEIEITDENKQTYLPPDISVDKAYCIRVKIRNHKDLILNCGLLEHRGRIFNSIAAILQPKVVDREITSIPEKESISSSEISSQPSLAQSSKSSAKRTRKSGLQDEVIKPTDDLT